MPMWMPGASGPSVKCQQSDRSPTSQAGHTGEIPRGAHDSQGLSTTRSPTERPSASAPTSTTSATTSCPSTCGNEVKSIIGLLVSTLPLPQSMRDPEHVRV